MRIVMIGAGGVGSAAAGIVARRDFAEHVVVADYEETRARTVVDRLADKRLHSAHVDASDSRAVAELLRASKADAVLNACDPRFVMPIFDAARETGTTYLDMAMSLSHPHPDQPYQKTGVKLGDEQFATAADWQAAGLLALVGIGVEPGLSDVFARYAAD